MSGIAEYTFSLVGKPEDVVTATANTSDWAWELAEEAAKKQGEELEDFLYKEEVK